MQNAILSAALLKAQIQDFHAQSVKNGFYDDYPTQESRQTEEFICSRAMLISGEIHEAYEAFRSGKIDADSNVSQALSKAIDLKQDDILRYAMLYKEHIKGTVAEELADTYIRICCVAGSVGLYEAGDVSTYDEDISELLRILNKGHKKDGIHTCFYYVARAVDFAGFRCLNSSGISEGLAAVYFLADKLQIDLHLHVKLKAFYNTTREYKHGRNF